MVRQRMRILYIMHVDWRWIRQRPHYFAEYLAEAADVLVLYRPTAPYGQRVKNESFVHRLPLLPIPRRFGPLFARLDALLQRLWLTMICLFFRPDIIWLTYPSTYAYVPSGVGRHAAIVYDCMDDALGFTADAVTLRRLKELEADTVRGSALVMCSSKTLMQRLQHRYGASGKYLLVRNGVTANLVERSGDYLGVFERRAWLDVSYIGTVAEWFDFPTIVACLDRLPRLRIHIIGPRTSQCPSHARVIYHGVVAHSELAAHVREHAAFIMPFVVTSLVEAVDPVKLYEYLAFGKEVITVFYPEIQRFEPYVHFYDSLGTLHDLLSRLEQGTLTRKNANGRVQDFLAENTWERRGSVVHSALEKLLRGREV